MKYTTYFLLIIILASCNAISKPSANTTLSVEDSLKKATSFKIDYQLSAPWAIISSVLQTKDGYLAIGYAQKKNVSTDGVVLNMEKMGQDQYYGFVLKVNSFGDTLWSKLINKYDSQTFGDFCNSRDGNYLLLGFSTNDGKDKVSVMKINANGEEIYYQTYSPDVFSSASFIIQDTDNGYLIGGTKYVGAYESDIVLVKIDETGEIIWKHEYHEGKSSRITNAKKTKAGTTIIAAYMQESAGAKRYLFEVDTIGKVLWKKVYGGDYYLADVVEDEEGFVTVGNSSSNRLAVMKVDYKGEKVWEKEFSHQFSKEANSIFRTTKGDFVIGGIQGTGSNSRDVLLFKINTQGELIWEKLYPGAQLVYSVSTTSDDGYIIGGFDSMGFTNGWGVLVKVDKDGVLNTQP
jgi:hypothetical protein